MVWVLSAGVALTRATPNHDFALPLLPSGSAKTQRPDRELGPRGVLPWDPTGMAAFWRAATPPHGLGGRFYIMRERLIQLASSPLTWLICTLLTVAGWVIEYFGVSCP
jgi:hypothetical protein